MASPRYETDNGRARYRGPEVNLADAVLRLQARGARAPWHEALVNARLPLYDVHWTPAIVLSTDGNGPRVGLSDGRIVPLAAAGPGVRRSLKPYDVVFTRVLAPQGRIGARAELRVRPAVQSAALILENATGRVLALAGGFSYPLSQLNRATQAQRQPGSAIKPLTYLAALQSGLQPNTLVKDQSITLPPINSSARAQANNFWTPKNYDGHGSGIVTLRRGLEHSKNLVTARLPDGAIAASPQASLERVVPTKAALLIVGDVDQFPSVGRGQVLADMIASGAIPVVRLAEFLIRQRGNVKCSVSSGKGY
jgi:penicillin-binding protein 1A